MNFSQQRSRLASTPAVARAATGGLRGVFRGGTDFTAAGQTAVATGAVANAVFANADVTQANAIGANALLADADTIARADLWRR